MVDQPDENEMTNQVWSALVSTPDGKRARTKALRDVVGVLIDMIVEIDERHPTGASETDKDILAAVRMIAAASLALVKGVISLLPGNPYAASALVRQMVEVEYLSWTCAHDSEEVVDWLTSNRERRLARWQPRQLRKRAGDVFDEEDYRGHCEMGGHPTPVGIAALTGDLPRAFPSRGLASAQAYEALVHSLSTAGHLAVAAARIHPKVTVAPIRVFMIQEEWASGDPATRWTADVQSGNDPIERAAVLEFARSRMSKNSEGFGGRRSSSQGH